MAGIRALLEQPDPVRWLFAGDSITMGAKHTLGWRSYTEIFAERVRWELNRRRDIVFNTAVSGWTVADLSADVEWSVLQFKPHCVSIMLGMNDCTRGGATGVDGFRDIYLALIERIRRETGAHILLHTPNWLLPTGGPRHELLPLYAGAIRSIAHATESALVDHLPEWLGAEEKGVMHHWIGHGCHPNENGHRVLAHALFRALSVWDESSWTCRLFVPR